MGRCASGQVQSEERARQRGQKFPPDTPRNSVKRRTAGAANIVPSQDPNLKSAAVTQLDSSEISQSASCVAGFRARTSAPRHGRCPPTNFQPCSPKAGRSFRRDAADAAVGCSLSSPCTEHLAQARAASKSAKLRLAHSGRYLAVRKTDPHRRCHHSHRGRESDGLTPSNAASRAAA